MKTFFAVAIPVAALSIVAIAAPAVSAQTGVAQCIASTVTPGTNHVVIYVSQIVPAPGQAKALNGAWGAFVQATYHLDKVASATCNAFSADPAVQQKVIATEHSAWSKNGMQVVDVNWQAGQPARSGPDPAKNLYAAAGDAPAKDAAPKDAPSADAAPPADQGPPPRASYCYSDDKKTPIYFSDAFDTADLPSSKAWSTAFSKFLTQKYMYKGVVNCKDLPTISKVQSAILDQKDALQGKETVDTDWSYAPPAPGEAAPADDAAATATPAAKSKTAKASTAKSTTPKSQ
jgi:hypothetical protein